MNVETFECTETAAEPIEAAEEAVALIESLGLTGQQKLIKRAQDSAESKFDQRNPYRVIREDELFVYKALCPKVVKLTEYDAGPIPLRILQIASHAKEFFTELLVMYQPEVVEKDPVLIGSHERYSSVGPKDFILARWGDELESFPVLMQRAIAKMRDRLKQMAARASKLVETSTDADIVRHGTDKYHYWSESVG